MTRYEVCRHVEVPYEVLTCVRCGDAFRCCPCVVAQGRPVCAGNRSLCLDCEAFDKAGTGADRREGGAIDSN